MNHSIKDPELKALLEISRSLKKAYETIDKFTLEKYTKLAKKKKVERRVNSERRQNAKKS